MKTERTDLTSDIDGALASRNSGENGFAEVARSGNGNMRDDLMPEGKDYEETEAGETIEEMAPAESRAADRGQAPPSFREPRAGEAPPHAPKPGTAWMRRRIPTGTRRPGGNRLVRARWCMVSPLQYSIFERSGQICDYGDDHGKEMGFVDISSREVIFAVVGAGLAIAAMMGMRRRV